jgi:hypothetical protein
MLRQISLILAFVFAACSPQGTLDRTNGVPANENTDDWKAVRGMFSTLTTIAGKGASDNGNEWQPSFEDAPAVTAELSRPHMAQADSKSNIYIANKESHAIRRVAPDGTITTFAGINVAGNAPNYDAPATQGALSNPNGLWVSSSDNVYIVDLDNKKIRRVTPNGTMSTFITLSTLETGRGLWVADDESEALIASGPILFRWTPAQGAKTLASGFVELGMVLRAPDGRILAGDRVGKRAYEVAENGKKTVIAGNGTIGPFVDGGLATKIGFDEPRAIWPFGSGLLVGLHNGCKIIYIDDEGYAHLMLQGSSKSHGGDGLPYDPTKRLVGELRSLTVDAQGNLIFVENDKGYVRKIKGVN